MSKRINFECFVHLYDVKYKISLSDVRNGYVLFDQLYKEIQKIDPKQDVSFETNTFEVSLIFISQLNIDCPDVHLVMTLSFRSMTKDTIGSNGSQVSVK